MSRAEHLVIDSGGFIKNAPIKDITEDAYTLNDVVSEIRDKATRARLQVLPYELHMKDVNPEALKFVGDFSKKTGDFPSLSIVDLKVIALTYELHMKHGGEIKDFDKEACQWNVPKNESFDKAVNIAGFYMKKTHISDDIAEDDAEAKEHRDEDDSAKSEAKSGDEVEQEVEQEVEHCRTRVEILADNEEQFSHSTIDQNSEGDYSDEYDSSDSDSDSDGGDWITPSNIADVKANTGDCALQSDQLVKVACLTTDFAMQNVMLQMGLNVLSVDGMLIKRARSYVLRCFACFKVTTIMTKEFCFNCGNKTLKKCAKVTNSEGKIEYQSLGRRQHTTRGMKYSLPTPKGGKHSSNPILCEDQRKPHERPCGRYLKGNKGILGEDFNCSNGNSPFALIDTESRAALAGIRTNQNTGTFRSRRNPNENSRVRKKK